VIDDRTLGRVMPRGMVALTGDLVRASAWMLVVVLLLTFAGVYARLAGLLFAKPGANDFTILYYTARMADDGFQMYGNLPTEYGLDWKAPHLGNLNPPHFQLLVAPLVPLGYRGALVAWLVANVLIVAACAWIVVRELRPALTLKRMLLATLLVFASAAWTSVAVTGEMSLLLLLPCTGAWVAARRGRWEVAGVLLGVAASLKVFLLVFGAWLIVARLHRLSHVGWWWLPMNLSLRGMADRVFVAHGPFAAVFAAPAVVQPAWLVAALVVVAVTAWRTWPARGVDVDRVFATLLVAALLVSPLGWIYYLPLATAPVVALAIRRELSGPGPLRVALAAIALAFLYVPVEVTERGQPSALATLGLACAHGWGALLLWVRLVLRDAPPAAGSAA
jgi:hypothetical protein